MIGHTESDQLVLDAMDLIRIPSGNPPGNERPVAEWLEQRLAPFAEVRVVGVAENRSNFSAVFDFGAGPTLVFCTHTDVVPVQDEQQWSPVVRDGRLYGRGACDSKGAIAAMAAACLRLQADARELGGRLILAAVADEESGALGARALLADGLTADAAIIGEPTANQPVLASRGAVRLAVTFSGRSAHASAPSNGRNAVYGAARFITGIERYQEALTRRANLSSCAATVVSGGTQLNVVPDTCTVLIDRRVGPSDTCDGAAAEIESLAAESIFDLDGITFGIESAGVWLEPFELSVDAPFAQLLLSLLGGAAPGPIFTGGTDAPHFISAGIPTAIFGPGSLATAHTAEEFVQIDDLFEAASAYERIARGVLGSKG